MRRARCSVRFLRARRLRGLPVTDPLRTGGDVQATGSVHATVQLGSGVTLPPVNNAPTMLAQFSAVLVSVASDTLSLKPPQGITSVTTNPATEVDPDPRRHLH